MRVSTLWSCIYCLLDNIVIVLRRSRCVNLCHSFSKWRSERKNINWLCHGERSSKIMHTSTTTTTTTVNANKHIPFIRWLLLLFALPCHAPSPKTISFADYNKTYCFLKMHCVSERARSAQRTVFCGGDQNDNAH